jgi:hypothetical protein
MTLNAPTIKQQPPNNIFWKKCWLRMPVERGRNNSIEQYSTTLFVVVPTGAATLGTTTLCIMTNL